MISEQGQVGADKRRTTRLLVKTIGATLPHKEEWWELIIIGMSTNKNF